jgi:hypothetical protein
MPYGAIKVDNITFTNGGADQPTTVSGIYRAITSGVTVTGTISGVTIQGATVSGTTVTGTTANFVSGVFTTQLSGATITGTTASFTSGVFTALSGASTTVTSGIFAVGSAAAPSISFTSDPNTGIYSPGADQVAISTNGTQRLTVQSDGNVLIGATGSAGRLLTVNQTGTTGGEYGIRVSQTSATSNAISLTIDSTNGLSKLFQESTIPLVFGTNNTERARIDSSGNVGIGTTSPLGSLHIETPATTAGWQLRLDSVGLANESGFYRDASDNYEMVLRNGLGGLTYLKNNGNATDANLVFFPNGVERARIDSSGRLLVGTSSNDSNALAVVQGYAGLASGQGVLAMRLGTTRPAAADTEIGSIRFESTSNTSSNYHYASISAFSDGASSSDTDIPGRLVFSTTADGAASPTERMRITSTGAVGIGITTPGAFFHAAGTIRAGAADTSDAIIQIGASLSGSRNSYLDLVGDTTYSTYGLRVIRNNSGANATSRLLHRGTGSLDMVTQEAAPITFWTTNTERARIDSSGRLLVGTSSYTGNGKVAIAGGTGTNIALLDLRYNSTRPTAADTGLVEIRFGAADQASNNSYAKIEAITDGASSSDSDLPGRLVFSTTEDGAASPTERMRITSTGSAFFGAISTKNATTRSFAIATTGEATVYCNHGTGDVSTDPYLIFNYNGTKIGSITQSGTTAVAYNTSSDYRLKENVVPLAGAIDRINNLQVRRFNFIADPAKTVDGFIAHEAQAVVPECVTGEKDAVDDDGNPVYQGIDQSKLVPLLTAALQEAIAKIEALETRLSALEGA